MASCVNIPNMGNSLLGGQTVVLAPGRKNYEMNPILKCGWEIK